MVKQLKREKGYQHFVTKNGAKFWPNFDLTDRNHISTDTCVSKNLSRGYN